MGSIPPDASVGVARQRRKHVTVLVTGFGPFQERYPINPSYEIARALPSTILQSKAGDPEISIIGYGQPIRVCYEQVRDLVPILHESYLGTVDLVLHIGMASGRSHYTAELYAHRDGYNKNKDLDGVIPPVDDGLVSFGDCPAMMTTSLQYDEVLRGWKANLDDLPESSPAHGVDCRSSEDAGHYLCDYIYFNSLAWFGRRSGKLDGGKGSDRPVLFLHVPAESDEVTLERGRQVALALIEVMVQSWCNSTASNIT